MDENPSEMDEIEAEGAVSTLAQVRNSNRVVVPRNL